ncbi:hypothetical protein GIB67_039484 [Kingdonia uniflora]|uniref:Protein kinase domain-containing protein n=1 Tax=Kingdonia uniflora TaxID=39325 RepID=A0A7J7LJ21_9MAGN|nr:hypothetical protein GIB67_039484 [Kingdonia uniflora]
MSDILQLLWHPDIVEIKHIVLPPSRREFKVIYVVLELMESSPTNEFHRDLKPKNILANVDCKLKICDFVIVRVSFNDAPSAIFWADYVATRWYRAPELCGSFFYKLNGNSRIIYVEEEAAGTRPQIYGRTCLLQVYKLIQISRHTQRHSKTDVFEDAMFSLFSRMSLKMQWSHDVGHELPSQTEFGSSKCSTNNSLCFSVVNKSIIGTKEIIVLIERAKLAKKRDLKAARHQEPIIIDVTTCVQKLGRKYRVRNNSVDAGEDNRAWVETEAAPYFDEERTVTNIEYEPQASGQGECTGGGKVRDELELDLEVDDEYYGDADETNEFLNFIQKYGIPEDIRLEEYLGEMTNQELHMEEILVHRE